MKINLIIAKYITIDGRLWKSSIDRQTKQDNINWKKATMKKRIDLCIL